MVEQCKESHDVPDSSRISEEVHDQLQYSKDMYNNDYPDIKKSCDNTMKDGCCCGVFSYRDFLLLGYCKCLPPRNRGYGYGLATSYGTGDFFCNSIREYNITPRGCFRYISRHIQHDRKQIHVAKMIIFMFVSTV